MHILLSYFVIFVPKTLKNNFGIKNKKISSSKLKTQNMCSKNMLMKQLFAANRSILEMLDVVNCFYMVSDQ